MPRPDHTTSAGVPAPTGTERVLDTGPTPETPRRPTSRARPSKSLYKVPSKYSSKTLPTRRPPQRPERARGPLGSLDQGSVFFVVSVVAIIVVLVAAGALDDLQGDSTRTSAGGSRTTRAAAPHPAPTPRHTRSASPTPTASADSWKQAWSVDLGIGSDATISTYANDDYLVVYDWDKSNNQKSRLRGYSLTDGRPQELWSTSAGELKGLTSSVAVTDGSLIDPATGEVTEAPWGESHPVLVTDDLIITCSTSSVCAGWDSSGPVLTQRWGPVTLPGNHLPRFDRYGITGNTSTGYALARVRDTNARADSIAFVSLEDGGIGTTLPEEDGDKLFAPADDGWLQLGAAQGAQRPITALEPDGTEKETYTASQYAYALLLTDSGSGLPSLDQYRDALASGDVSWASLIFDCRPNTCELDQHAIPGTDNDTRSSPMNAGDVTATVSERYLIMSYGSMSGRVRIIDREKKSVVPEGESLYGQRAHTVVARADLLIAVEDGGLAAYAPPG